MKSQEVSRRFVVGALGAGAALTVARVVDARPGAMGRGPGGTDADAGGPGVAPSGKALVATEARRLEALVTPLTAGSRLGVWQVEQMMSAQAGSLSLIMLGVDGERFQLDVCARDTSAGAAASPGNTEHFQIFVANTGDGATSTLEAQGLAAMALADVIRGNEQAFDRAAFVTLATRNSQVGARLHCSV